MSITRGLCNHPGIDRGTDPGKIKGTIDEIQLRAKSTSAGLFTDTAAAEMCLRGLM